ncbi:MAG: GIY-YIG nuclease family protein [Bacteroidota bacterium]
MYREGWHTYYVYILTNRNKTVLYTGMTNNLRRRLYEHHKDILENKKSFVSKYKCQHLLHDEEFTSVQEAIARDKEIKGWLRIKKLERIKTSNPKMDFIENRFPYQDTLS